jgi:hypothetical protein
MYSRNDISDSLNVFVGYRLSFDSSSGILCQAQNHPNHVVNKSHYPDSLVNPNFRYIDYTLVLRITITNESLGELSKVYITFGQVTQLLASTPPVEIRNPPQWKLRVDPSSGKVLGLDSPAGNMVLIR